MFIIFERACREGAERGRHRIGSRFQALSSQHTAPRGARTHRLQDHDLSCSQLPNQLSHPGTPLGFQSEILCQSGWKLDSCLMFPIAVGVRACSFFQFLSFSFFKKKSFHTSVVSRFSQELSLHRVCNLQLAAFSIIMHC